MKTFFTIIFILVATSCFAQTQKRDTVKVQSNTIQLEKLGAIEQSINEKRKEYNSILEIIFGIRIEEIEWWSYKQGKFLYVIKQPTKPK